jgi:hypothetical protein
LKAEKEDEENKLSMKSVITIHVCALQSMKMNLFFLKASVRDDVFSFLSSFGMLTA